MAYTGYTSTDYFLYRSTDSGAPSVTNTVGCLVTLLTDCLVNGYGSKTLTSLVVSSGVATATVSGGHSFTNFGALTVGPVITISGVTDLTGLNGNKRINVLSSTTFEFDATGISDGTAGGTITAKIAPAGWSTAYTGTNKAAYKSNAIDTEGFYFRVDHSATGAYARAVGYESMSDVDTGTNAFPTNAQVSGGLYIFGSSAASTRTWYLVATNKSVVLVIDYDGTGGFYSGFAWLELEEKNVADIYTTTLIGATSSSYTLEVINVTSSSYCYSARNTVGDVGAVNSYRYGPHQSANKLTLLENPTTPYSGYYWLFPWFLWESTSKNRGIFELFIASNINATAGTITYHEVNGGYYNNSVILVSPYNNNKVVQFRIV